MSKCTKKSFVYYNIAKMALRKIRAHPNSVKGDRIPCDIYLCPDCGAYHLTSMTKAEFKNKKRTHMFTITIPIKQGSADAKKMNEICSHFNCTCKQSDKIHWIINSDDPHNFFWLGMNLNDKLNTD